MLRKSDAAKLRVTKSKFGNVMPVVVVFCNLFCIHFLHKYSFRKVKYLMLRKSDAAKLRVTAVREA